MLNKNNFFRDYYFEKKKLKKNIEKAKEAFKHLKLDIDNFQIPLIESFDKSYENNFSNEIIKKFSKYKNIIIIGMGGSILGAKSIYSFLQKKTKKKLFFFDDLNTNQHQLFKESFSLKNSCFIIISKSGDTIETISNLCLIFPRTLLVNRLIFITEIKDSAIHSIADKFNAEIIEHKDFIGGRYSVMSEVGMFPAALMGFNIKRFKNLRKLIVNKYFISSLIQNVASIFTLNRQNVKNSIILNYDTKLNDLGLWYQQLSAESLGKKGRGIMPVLSLAPRDHHSVLQLYLDGPRDKFFTFFSTSNQQDKWKIPGKIIPDNMNFLKDKKLSSVVNAQCKAVKNIFRKKNIPFRYFIFKKSNEEELGSALTFFVLETILLARLMKVNPFDQPSVEEIKTETKRILSK